jgi:hypothetical protein
MPWERSIAHEETTLLALRAFGSLAFRTGILHISLGSINL